MDDLISRQAAIEAVAELASSMSVCISVDECHGMKRMQGMAVRALDDLPSVQPQSTMGQVNEAVQSTNDCISRQAAIDAIDIGCELLRRALDDTDVVGVERAKYEWGLGLIESYIADIKELPSAQPQRMKGRWIGYAGTIGAECSECHKWLDVIQGTAEMNYCPNCGADMRGEQNGKNS